MPRGRRRRPSRRLRPRCAPAGHTREARPTGRGRYRCPPERDHPGRAVAPAERRRTRDDDTASGEREVVAGDRERRPAHTVEQGLPDGQGDGDRRQASSCRRNPYTDGGRPFDPLTNPDGGNRFAPGPSRGEVHRLARPEQPFQGGPVTPPRGTLKPLAPGELECTRACRREQRRRLARRRAGREREPHVGIGARLVGNVGVGNPPRREERHEARDEDRGDQPPSSAPTRSIRRLRPDHCPCFRRPCRCRVAVVVVVDHRCDRVAF